MEKSMLPCRGAEILNASSSNRKCPSESFPAGKTWLRVCKKHEKIVIERKRILCMQIASIASSYDPPSIARLIERLEGLHFVSRAFVIIDSSAYDERAAFELTGTVVIVVKTADHVNDVLKTLQDEDLGVKDFRIGESDETFLRCNIHKTVCPSRNFNFVSIGRNDESCLLARWKQQQQQHNRRAREVIREAKEPVTDEARTSAPVGASVSEMHEAVVFANVARTAMALDILKNQVGIWTGPPNTLMYSSLTMYCHQMAGEIRRLLLHNTFMYESGWADTLHAMATAFINQNFYCPPMLAASESAHYSQFIMSAMNLIEAINQINKIFSFVNMLHVFRDVNPFDWLHRIVRDDALPPPIESYPRNTVASMRRVDGDGLSTEPDHHRRPFLVNPLSARLEYVTPAAAVTEFPLVDHHGTLPGTMSMARVEPWPGLTASRKRGRSEESTEVEELEHDAAG